MYIYSLFPLYRKCVVTFVTRLKKRWKASKYKGLNGNKHSCYFSVIIVTT